MVTQGMNYIYAVYQEKSFSKAARSLFISQPALSASVRRTEEQLGFPVFDRSCKPLSLTPDGEAYIRTIEKILAAENEFDAYIADTRGLRTGSLCIGGSSLYASWVLPSLIAHFHREWPEIRLSLVEQSTETLTKRLQAGTIDLLLDNSRLDPFIFDRQVFANEELYLAVPSSFPVNDLLTDYQVPLSVILDHQETEIKPVPLHAFAAEPFVLLTPENDTGARAREAFEQSGISPQVFLTLDQQMGGYNITLNGLAIAFVSSTLIRHVPFHDHIIYYRLQTNGKLRQVCFYWKHQRYRTSAMDAFLSGVEKENL